MSQKLALIIGNSQYEDPGLARLAAPDADAQALAAVLRDPQIGAFDEVQALINQPAATVRRAISAFFTGRGKDDLLLLYFTGHGVRDDRGQLFLAVKDTEHRLLRGTAIPAGFITEEMDNSRSRRQVLVLDCCHSGAFSQGMKAATGASVGTAAAFEGSGSGRVVLTATDSTQYAWEGDRVIGQAENSVFTHYLIQGLRSGQADGDGDGRITLDELYAFVYEQVVEQTPLQTPGKWSYGQQGEMVIARNPRPVVRPVPLPLDLQQTIDDPRPWVREGAVQELDRILRGGNRGMILTALEALSRLADDDSRRVAALAAGSLAAYGESAGLAAAGAPVPGGSIAVTAAPAAANVTGPAAQRPPFPETRPAAETWAADEPPAAAPAGGVMGRLWAALRALPWQAMATTATGWAVGVASGLSVSWEYGSLEAGLAGGVFAGLGTGLGFWRAGIPLHWKHVLAITAGITAAMYLAWDNESLAAVLIGSSELWDHDSPLVGVMIGALSGLATGLVLRWARQVTGWATVLLIAGLWGLSLYLGQAFASALVQATQSSVDSIGAVRLVGLVIGGVSGLLASAAMYGLLRARPPAQQAE